MTRHHCLHPENCVAGKAGPCRLCQSPEMKAAQSERIRRLWADPEFRSAQLAKRTATWYVEAQTRRDAGETLQAIADRFGVCRERVRQVTKPIPAEVQAEIFRRQYEAARLVPLDRIRECAAAGMSKAETARHLGYSRGDSLGWTKKRHGIQFQNGRRPKHNRDLAVELFAAGVHPAEIAPLTGYKSAGSVFSVLHKLGITCHSRGDFKHREAAE